MRLGAGVGLCLPHPPEEEEEERGRERERVKATASGLLGRRYYRSRTQQRRFRHAQVFGHALVMGLP